jgi:RNA recognition motif-containing protein
MSRKLFVGNLPLSATEADLRLKFGRFGAVESATIVQDPHTGRSKRCGFIEMTNDTEARNAISRLNMTQYEDTIMSVREAPAGSTGSAP